MGGGGGRSRKRLPSKFNTTLQCTCTSERPAAEAIKKKNHGSSSLAMRWIDHAMICDVIDTLITRWLVRLIVHHAARAGAIAAQREEKTRGSRLKSVGRRIRRFETK